MGWMVTAEIFLDMQLENTLAYLSIELEVVKSILYN